MKSDHIMWKPVVGLEGRYEVSNTGLVRSVMRLTTTTNGQARMYQAKIIKPCTNRGGYHHVCLWDNSSGSGHRVHRLVMMAFSANDNHANLDVNHIDGDKTNNHISNLEWVTRGENHKHRYQILGQKHSFVGRVGKMHARSKPVVGVHLQTGDHVFFESASQASIAMNMCVSKICACARGQIKTHKKYAWNWANTQNLTKSTSIAC